MIIQARIGMAGSSATMAGRTTMLRRTTMAGISGANAIGMAGMVGQMPGDVMDAWVN